MGAELWNGSSWTEVNDLNTARWEVKGGGTYTSSIIAGGRTPATPNTVAIVESQVANTETWNGSAWTEQMI